MKTDAYTKVVLTGIAIFLGFIAFDYKPTINAHAGATGGGEMIVSGGENSDGVSHLRNGKIRSCWVIYSGETKPKCGEWSD
jgi:hypothetical protein